MKAKIKVITYIIAEPGNLKNCEKIRSNLLRKNLQNLIDEGYRKYHFWVKFSGLPAYIIDHLAAVAEECFDDYVSITHENLLQFLEIESHRIFKSKIERNFAQIRQDGLYDYMSIGDAGQ